MLSLGLLEASSPFPLARRWCMPWWRERVPLYRSAAFSSLHNQQQHLRQLLYFCPAAISGRDNKRNFTITLFGINYKRDQENFTPYNKSQVYNIFLFTMTSFEKNRLDLKVLQIEEAILCASLKGDAIFCCELWAGVLFCPFRPHFLCLRRLEMGVSLLIRAASGVCGRLNSVESAHTQKSIRLRAQFFAPCCWARRKREGCAVDRWRSAGATTHLGSTPADALLSLRPSASFLTARIAKLSWWRF